MTNYQISRAGERTLEFQMGYRGSKRDEKNGPPYILETSSITKVMKTNRRMVWETPEIHKIKSKDHLLNFEVYAPTSNSRDLETFCDDLDTAIEDSPIHQIR